MMESQSTNARSDSNGASTGHPLDLIDDSVILNEGGEFPALYQHLPRFWTTGVENGKITAEPTVVSIYKPSFKDMWILIISFPGVTAPYGSWSVKKVMAKAKEFQDRNCWVFLLTLDTWTSVRQYRTELESKINKLMGVRSYDVEGITFIIDHQKKISKNLGVLCEGKSEAMCYPGYFLLTPDKELVQFCVIKDAKQMYERDAKTYFAYPMNEEVVDSLLLSIETLKPFYGIVRKLRQTYPRATFGTFMENIIRLVQSDKKDEENESIFKWRGWAETFGGVLGGGLK